MFTICLALFQETSAGSSRDHDPNDEPPRYCIICKTCDGENMRAFDDRTWAAVKRAAEYRLHLKTDRYRDVTTELNLQTGCGRALYHSKPCYKNFTAVKRSACESSDEPPLKKPETRRRSSHPQNDVKGLLKGSCIFCGKARKTSNQKAEILSDCLTKDGCDKILAAATQSTNERMKALVSGGIDLIAKEVQYHKSCRRDFFKDVEGPRQMQAAQATNRQLHADTFNTVAAFIETWVIKNGQAMLVSSLFEVYKAEYIGNGGTEEDSDSYTPQSLTRKIQDRFKDRLSISLIDNRRGNVLYSSALSEDDARASLKNEKEKRQAIIRSAALHLRNEIQEMPKWRTPTPTSVETLKTCSPDLPDDLLLFFRTLLCGLREPTGDTNKDNIDRKVMAMSSDAVFNASRGSVRPWKQTVLGLGIGTLTGSKLILRILNRLGYSLSYDEIKALETEFAFSTEESDHDAPDGIELKPDLGTGLAWDNYDVNMETLDGKDTLHATVGICYQNMTNGNETNVQPVATRSGRNRRQFAGQAREIAPMHGQLNKACFDISASDNHQETLTQRTIDFYWLMMSQVMPQPLFVGFFSQFVQDDLPKQIICYMDPIPHSPTGKNIVRETMKRSMKVANETTQDYAVVTYDLAVALIAYKIQSIEAPLFDRLLIMLGNFHLELAFYGAVGTYINESGAEHLLTECEILAEGSLNGFIRGKYYNRCSRVHEILALVMEKKLYHSFLSTLPQERRDALSILLNDVPSECSVIEPFLETNEMFREHMEQYEKFFANVMQGALGPTAQYWCGCVYLIHRVHRDVMRALRTNDIESYITILPTVINVFFGLNRPNYARWGVLFLTKLEAADPQIRTVLETGAFSIRRTSKAFSRTAIDLTLEQMVNRDAASPMRSDDGALHQHSAECRLLS